MRSRIGLGLFALACGVLAACANTTGGTSTMPGGQLPQLQNPVTPSGAPTATPAIQSGLVRVPADGSAVTVPAPGDFKVTAVWPATAPSTNPSASPSGSASPSAVPASTASPIVLNATASVPGPGGIPAFGATLKHGFLVSHRELGPVLLYVWFESDKNVTISSLPTLDVSIPLTLLEPYGTDPQIKLAIYDPARENKWTEGVAERAEVTPSPKPSGSAAAATATASATASATPTPSPTPTMSATPTQQPFRGPGAPGQIQQMPQQPTASPGIRPMASEKPPVQTMTVRFVPAQRSMKLLAKKNLVFVVYAEPAPTDTPSPSPSGSAAASTSPSPAVTASPSSPASPAASPSSSP